MKAHSDLVEDLATMACLGTGKTTGIAYAVLFST